MVDPLRESEYQGEQAYFHRRYSSDTRARLVSGKLGIDAQDAAFRRGYERARRNDARIEEEWDD